MRGPGEKITEKSHDFDSASPHGDDDGSDDEEEHHYELVEFTGAERDNEGDGDKSGQTTARMPFMEEAMEEKKAPLGEPCQSTEYEEVVLRKARGTSRLGITLCYDCSPDGMTAQTGVFVQSIEAGSPAEKNGRIHVGDRLLQINGIRVGARRDVLREFATAGGTDISLLLSRSVPEGKNDYDEDEESDEEDSDEDTEILGQTTLLLPVSHHGPLASSRCNPTLLAAQQHHYDTVAARSRVSDAQQQELLGDPSDRRQQQAITKPAIEGAQRYDEEISRLHRQMHLIQLECERLLNQQRWDAAAAAQLGEGKGLSVGGNKQSSHAAASKSPMASQIEGAKQAKDPVAAMFKPLVLTESYPIAAAEALGKREVETSSSAYNTGGDSCRSTPQQNNKTTNVNGASAAYSPRPLHVTNAEILHLAPLDVQTPVGSQSTVSTTLAGLLHGAQSNNTGRQISAALPKKTAAWCQPPPLPTTTSIKASAQPPITSSLVAQPPQTSTQKAKGSVVDSSTASFRYPSSITPQTATPVDIHPIFRPGDTMYTSKARLAETIALQQQLLKQTIDDQRTWAQQSKQKQQQQQSAKPQQQHHLPLAAATSLRGVSGKAIGPTNVLSQFSQLHHPVISRPASNLQQQPPESAKSTASHRPLQPREQQYEWKARRRPDGSLYIVRRPLGAGVRQRVLKARERKVDSERRTGLSTTDDDGAGSELKAGRYWPRSQRKDHLEHAREKKQWEKSMAYVSRAKLASSRAEERRLMALAQQQQQQHPCGAEGDEQIVEHPLLDKFTTVQEYLAHGGRTEAPQDSTEKRRSKNFGSALLSVTTV